MVRSKDGDGIESNKIIFEVEKRPCLYDSNNVYYGDRAEKMRSWEEVYECVVPGWSTLGVPEKLVAGKEVQKRWRSIRDSYTKAYRQGRCPRAGAAPGSRRQLHHARMGFLLRALQNKKPRYTQDKYDSFSEVSSSPQHPDDTRPQEEKTDNPAGKPLDKLLEKPLEKPLDKSLEKPLEKPLDKPLDLKTRVCHKECQVSFESISPEEHFKDDKMFMNSLLPLFKQMSDDTRLLCRIEVLKIIRYALQGHKTFEELRVAEDRFFEVSMGILGEKMTTRSADGSRPVRKRKTRSPSPNPTPVKRRGPGRPRKIRPADSDEERYVKKRLIKKPKVEAPPPDEDSYGHATRINQLPMPTFMKMLNLERSNTNVQIKKEPADEVVLCND